MPLLRLLLNILWIITGGVWMAALWLLAGVIMVITIVGIPWARAAFNIAVYTLLPFGQTAVDRADHTGQNDVGTGPLGTAGHSPGVIQRGTAITLLHHQACGRVTLAERGRAQWAGAAGTPRCTCAEYRRSDRTSHGRGAGLRRGAARRTARRSDSCDTRPACPLRAGSECRLRDLRRAARQLCEPR